MKGKKKEQAAGGDKPMEEDAKEESMKDDAKDDAKEESMKDDAKEESMKDDAKEESMKDDAKDDAKEESMKDDAKEESMKDDVEQKVGAEDKKDGEEGGDEVKEKPAGGETEKDVINVEEEETEKDVINVEEEGEGKDAGGDDAGDQDDGESDGEMDVSGEPTEENVDNATSEKSPQKKAVTFTAVKREVHKKFKRDKTTKREPWRTNKPVQKVISVLGRHRRATLLEMLLAPELRHERNLILQCVRHAINEDFFDPEDVVAARKASMGESSQEHGEEKPEGGQTEGGKGTTEGDVHMVQGVCEGNDTVEQNGAGVLGEDTGKQEKTEGASGDVEMLDISAKTEETGVDPAGGAIGDREDPHEEKEEITDKDRVDANNLGGGNAEEGDSPSTQAAGDVMEGSEEQSSGKLTDGFLLVDDAFDEELQDEVKEVPTEISDEAGQNSSVPEMEEKTEEKILAQSEEVSVPNAGDLEVVDLVGGKENLAEGPDLDGGSKDNEGSTEVEEDNQTPEVHKEVREVKEKQSVEPVVGGEKVNEEVETGPVEDGGGKGNAEEDEAKIGGDTSAKEIKEVAEKQEREQPGRPRRHQRKAQSPRVKEEENMDEDKEVAPKQDVDQPVRSRRVQRKKQAAQVVDGEKDESAPLEVVAKEEEEEAAKEEVEAAKEEVEAAKEEMEESPTSIQTRRRSGRRKR